MQIKRLNIKRVRNLKTVALPNLQPFNVFYGDNGSGKTSLLEAIHVLATGRSFRTHMPRHYIEHGAQDAIVFAQSFDEKLGIQKFLSGEQLIKVNGDSVATQGQLARLLPLQHLDPQSTDILDHGAKPRRQMLDWLMFHVEPDFYAVWQQYARALKQRNALLKRQQKPTLADLEPWNRLLGRYGEQMHSLRLSIIEGWQIYLQQEITQLLPELDIEMIYLPGFHSETGLEQDLIQSHVKDIERRHTEYGPHRADLRFKMPMGDADDCLSRGQKKLLILALKLSQIAMIHASNRETVVLLDDLTAELDHAAQRRLLERLSQLGSQVFITTLDQQTVVQHLHNVAVHYQLFHVEQGQIHAVSP